MGSAELCALLVRGWSSQVREKNRFQGGLYGGKKDNFVDVLSNVCNTSRPDSSDVFRWCETI